MEFRRRVKYLVTVKGDIVKLASIYGLASSYSDEANETTIQVFQESAEHAQRFIEYKFYRRVVRVERPQTKRRDNG